MIGTQGTPEVVREGRTLLGFMEEHDALRFLQGMCVWSPPKTPDELRKLWEGRRASVSQLKPGYEPPRVIDLRPEAEEHAKRTTETPMFKQAFAHSDWELKAVEIDRIVAFQKFLDTDYASPAGYMGKDPVDLSVLQACLPTEFHLESLVNLDGNAKSITFISRQMNPTIVGFGLVQGEHGEPIAQFILGSNANYAQAVEYRGRVTLKNGYHRAYALRAAGISFIPCVLIHAREFVETGAAREGFFGERVLYSDRPPLVSHFFNDDVSASIKLAGVKKIIRIRVDEAVLPA